MGNRAAAGQRAAPEDGQGKMRWGIGLSDLTPDVREQIQAPREVHGALIEQVQPGSSADNAGLQRGDVILEVNRHKVETAADVQQELGKVAKGQDALILVWSNGGNTFRVLHARRRLILDRGEVRRPTFAPVSVNNRSGCDVGRLVLWPLRRG